MKMTDIEIQECINYLNTRRNSIFIEVEMRYIDKTHFDTQYTAFTGLAVPADSTTLPYYVWAEDADPYDKWGIELRIYFISDENMPIPLQIRAKNNSRYGYEIYDKRVNNNQLIWRLFQNGYRLGQN